ncbi:MAG TPA: hypothetical protein VKA55_08365 [Gammaproteobacteria bacterium]|nr:hypothetical protein [Gammaproteobacteria bacterium]
MDTLSHTLWGGGLFGFRGRPRTALLFGALPDLAAFGPWLAYRLLSGRLEPGKPDLADIPAWVFHAYDVSHSLLVAGLATGLALRLRPALGFAMLAWPFHVLVDIPTHTRAFFPTPFLWPVSDVTVPGVSWATAWVWLPNLAGLVLLWAWRLGRRAETGPT